MTIGWMIALPLGGFVVLATLGERLGRRVIAIIGCTTVLLSLAFAVSASAPVFAASFPDIFGPEPAAVAHSTSGAPYVEEHLYTWFVVGDVELEVAFYLDALAALMALVVTGIGSLIHLYAAGYMADDPGYGRFFCYMNLFVAAMLTLVLADNLMLLYLGWEGVGACSYLLIGFWYQDPANGAAARKAFIVTRVGDAAMAVGLFLLARELGTLQIQPLMEGAARTWQPGDPTVTLAAVLLLLGALGKSAQLPLQAWLPDAMAGPTPVSALIHAATMVTAGVYLIARTHQLFMLAPSVMIAVAIIGAATAFVAACSALVQTDIKRVLAYSTISQIGYMFAALGVGAFAAAMFHLMTHAFFKALLFLSAGIVTHACHGESDIRRMGALRRGRALPAAAALAAVGAGSLAGLPLITSGFYSKDAILWATMQPPYGSIALTTVLLVTAGLTAVYAFRWYFLIFSGQAGPASRLQLQRPGALLLWPCLGLAAGALLAGFVEMPESLGGYHGFATFVEPVFAGTERLAAAVVQDEAAAETVLQVVSGAVSLLGMMLAYHWFILEPGWLERLAGSGIGRSVAGWWRSGWGADAAYEALAVRPFGAAARGLREEPVDELVRIVAGSARAGHWLLSFTQTGRLRTYLASLVVGAALLLTAWWWS